MQPVNLDTHAQPNHAETSDPDSNVNRMPKGQPAAQGVVLLAVAGAAAVLLGYGLHIVAARWLSTVSYGRFVVVVSVAMWLKNLQGTLILPGLYKCVSEDHRRLGAAVAVASKWYSAASIGLLALFLVACPFLGAAFGDTALVGLFMLAAIQLPFCAVMAFGQRLLNALRRYGAAAAVTTVYSAARACAGCALILLALGAAGAVGGLVVGSIVAGALALVLLLRERKAIPSVPYPPMLGRALSWTAVSVPTSCASTTLAAMDLWLVKAMMADPAAAGVYGTAYAVSRLPQFMVQGLVGAVFPRVSGALAEGNRALARSVSAEAMRLLAIIFVPVCFLVAGSASEITTLLFSVRYAGAGAPLALLIASMSCFACLSLMLGLIAAANHPGARMCLVLGLLPVGAVLNWLLIPRFGLEGAATASLITFAAGTLIAAFLVYHHIGAAPPLWTCLRCVAAGAIVYTIGLFWAAPGWLVVGKLAVLGTLYLAVLFVLRELRKEDLLTIKRAIWK